VLGKYVREERLLTLEEAVRRLTGFPAANLRLDRRGLLEVGYFADVVVFDPETVTDHATFEKPHQLATGVREVVVNGERVVREGEHTGVRAGRVVRGPGAWGT
jgi:N-acyl-D-amino-acid deacylase